MVAVLDFLAPEIEWKVRTDLPDARLYRGTRGSGSSCPTSMK